MQHLSAALIITLVIVVNQDGVRANVQFDQQAAESKNRAVTIVDGPKYVQNPNQPPPAAQHAQRPSTAPSKPPNIPPDKQNAYPQTPRLYYGHIQKVPPARHYPKPPQKRQYSPDPIYKYPRVIPLPPHQNKYYIQSRPLVFAASNGKPTIAKSPKFSLPVQTINGIRTDFVRPPKNFNATNTSTTTTAAPTTAAPTSSTTRVLRTKRIWPQRILDKINSTNSNTTQTTVNTTRANSTNYTDHDTSASAYRTRYVFINSTIRATTTRGPATTRSYRPVTRAPKVRSTTASAVNFTKIDSNDWVPIVPSHYPKLKRTAPTPISKRSDIHTDTEASNKGLMYLQSFGLVPMGSQSKPVMARKKMVFFKRKRPLNPHYSGYSRKPARAHYLYDDLEGEASHPRPQLVTKIKHHHHHHHHRYIKTVEKKVPYKVEVPKPYPVEKKVPVPYEKIKIVERPVPYPVTVEKKVPFPIGIKIPHPVPVKVVEKEYIPKPYPVIQQVPVVKHVQVKEPCPPPVQVEKKVPYPVEVRVPYPVDRPVAVPVEKRVPYPVPVKVLVPQPYPVETKVPYPVEVKVKEPYEVVKHVHVKVPVPQPYPVKVPHPVPVHVETKVPYPVEVEKKVPVPVRVLVPHRVEVEKKVPVYIPKPYPVEKRVPVPVKVPYPVRVPVRVPYEVPVVIHHPYQMQSEDYGQSQYNIPYEGDYVSSPFPVTDEPHHTVTVHGNTGFTGFQSRSDNPDDLNTTSPTSTPS